MDEILAGCRDLGIKHWTADHWIVGSPRRMSMGGGDAIIIHQWCSNDSKIPEGHSSKEPPI